MRPVLGDKAQKIRINELARELEVKAGAIIEILSQVGIEEKKTHSSSVDPKTATAIRDLLQGKSAPPPTPSSAPTVSSQPRGAWLASPTASPKSGPTGVQPRVPIISQPSLRIAGRGTPLRPPVREFRPPLKPRTSPAVGASAPPAAAGGQISPGSSALTAGRGGGVVPDMSPGASVPRGTSGLRPTSRTVTGPPTVPATPVKPIPSEAKGKASGPRAPLKRTAASPVGPVRSTFPPSAPGVGSVAAPSAQLLPGSPVVPPGGTARPRTRAARTPPGPAKPMVVPGKPIYQRPRSAPVPGLPTSRASALPQTRPRTFHPTGRPGFVPGGGPPRGPGQHRGPRPIGARTVRDPEAAREEKILRRQAAAKVAAAPPKAVHTEVTVSDGTTVKELGERLGLKANLVIKRLVDRGLFATINQTLDLDTIKDLCKYFGATATEVSFEEEAAHLVQQAEVPEDLETRPPVVTVMGHVDHGKTSLLDAIRETNIADREAGGITQAIGAYHVEKNGRRIVFLDTPGHEAFTRMRARGARVTDLVVLVVSADDGIMPQTVEAIDHAKAADVPILVAINKIDKDDADPERVKQQLADRGLLPEDWGGETVVVPVSAKTKENLDTLLEMILLLADIKELKANPARAAEGTVLESKLDRGQGPVATVLVQNGTLQVGDYFLIGSVFGKVRALMDDRSAKIKQAPPSSAVLVLGLEGLPEVGDALQVVTDTDKAKKVVEYRESRVREQALAKTARLSLDQFQERLRAGDVKELSLLLKADVQGSVEVLVDSVRKLSTEKVTVRIVHEGVGAISESDVLLAAASGSVIVGFNVRPERTTAALAEREKVDIRLHTVIYELLDEIKQAMTGLLDPVIKETYLGRAEVLEPFRVTKVGTIAGSVVQDGRVSRDSHVRLLRDNVVVYTGRVSSLRRFKDDAKEVRAGQECGIGLEAFNDVKQGDVIEAFVTEKVAQEVFA